MFFFVLLFSYTTDTRRVASTAQPIGINYTGELLSYALISLSKGFWTRALLFNGFRLENKIMFMGLSDLRPFLPRYATQSAVTPQSQSVCLSVRSSARLSVTLRYRDDISWNISKIISRPKSLRLMRELTSAWAIWCNGNTPKIRVE